jgi:serine protease AprX
MDPELEQLERWIYGVGQLRRFTQDSPVMPDVWIAYEAAPDEPRDLLLEPHERSDTAQLARAILQDAETPDDQPEMDLAYNQSHVAVRLTFLQMLRGVLPLSSWWQHYLWPSGSGSGSESVAEVLATHRDEIIAHMSSAMRDQGRRPVSPQEVPGTLVWFAALVGRIVLGPAAETTAPDDDTPDPRYGELVDAVAGVLGDLPVGTAPEGPLLWAINLNRQARHALWRSRNTVKADAATLLFDLSCSNLCWAVVDSGIDAGHPAFARREDGKAVPGSTRVKATYDFTGLRSLLSGKEVANASIPVDARREIARRLQHGRPVDWGMLVEHLEVKVGDGYRAPEHEHGTHVAGILGGDWRMTDDDATLDNDLKGICPDISLYDLRVFDKDGYGDEFAIIAALQFIRWTNANAPVPVIHGVNLSLSLDHAVGAFACGRTPICVECERLLGSGTVVVVAAGNEGRAIYAMQTGKTEGYRQMTITDPGNATGVITVGATHRHQPHTYGVSYFSSRGPTGDGRAKPDLVAPGEKVTAPVPGGGQKTLDGTSQAAPHVSGVAALMLARHPELIGQPAEIKRVLMATATDLGRERYFQGSGVVDALRAIQSI